MTKNINACKVYRGKFINLKPEEDTVKLAFVIPPEASQPAKDILVLGAALRPLCPDHKRLRFLRDPNGEARRTMHGLITGYSSTAEFSPEQIRQSSALSESSEANYAALWQEALDPAYDVVVVVTCVNYVCGMYYYLAANVVGQTLPRFETLLATDRMLVFDSDTKAFSFAEEAKPA